MSLLSVQDVHRSYRGPAGEVPVLRGVSLEVPDGAVHAITGPSGSGKSTLLRMLACLDTPDSGRITVKGEDLPDPWSREGDAYRNRECGIVLQDHLLIDRATALENAALPLLYTRPRMTRGQRRTAAAALLTRLGLEARLHHRVQQLSGGERQRVAIARAIVTSPSLVLADEPTGALDQKRTAEVTALFRSLAQPGRAVLIVTHDPAVAAACDRSWRLRDGVLE